MLASMSESSATEMPTTTEMPATTEIPIMSDVASHKLKMPVVKLRAEIPVFEEVRSVLLDPKALTDLNFYFTINGQKFSVKHISGSPKNGSIKAKWIADPKLSGTFVQQMLKCLA